MVTGPSLPSPLALAARVGRILEDLGVPWLLGGSLASSLYGEPRTTLDVDLVAALDPSTVGPFFRALGEEFYADPDGAREFVERGGEFNIIHLPSMTKVDIFPPSRGTDPDGQFRRRRKVVLPGGEGEIYVSSPEDTVLQKLIWYEEGGGVSDRQWRDVMGILKVLGGSLDLEWIAGRAEALGLASLLGRALAEAGLPEKE